MTVLRAIGLTRRFGGVRALDGAGVEADAGEIVAIVGPNGSGKSTLLNVLSGLDRPDAGAVALDGVDVTGRGAVSLARRGVVRTFQDGRLLEHVSALDNVLLGLHTAPGGLGATRGCLPGGTRRRRARALAALDGVGLAGLWAARVSTLSHGQRRRVELARALVGTPRLLLLDEPTGGLTPADTTVVARLVTDAAARGAAVLLVEHDLDVVGAVAARVIVLDEGRVVATGAPAAVLAEPPVAHLLGITGAVAGRLEVTA